MTVLAFSIKGWRAVSGRMASESDWRAWAQGELLPEALPAYRPALPFLPPMQRRRLGLPARLMLDAVWPLVGPDDQLPIVLASHDGEINRSFALWLALLQEHTVSPTSFGLSVHNALVGQWSMLRGDMSESTALCASGEGFELAITEACAMLAEGCRRVLVVQVEDPLSTDIQVPALRAPLVHAAAFVLEPGGQWCISRRPQREPAAHAPGYWGALDWIGHYCRGERRFEQRYSHCSWYWERCA